MSTDLVGGRGFFIQGGHLRASLRR
jgi:hypothetical protein